MLSEWISAFRLRIKALLRRRQLDRDLNDELQFHLAMRQQKLTESGVPAEEARYAARREFGNETRTKEVNREMWTFPFLETLWQDLRFGLRQLRRNPGFTAVAVITLALGIGANTAIFSVIDAVLLRPLPYANSNRLALVYPCLLRDGVWARISASPADFLDWKAQSNVFEDMAASEEAAFDLTGGPKPIHLTGSRATTDLFSVLRVSPLLGRTFGPSDAQAGKSHVAVLGYGLWQEAFGSSKDVLGKSIRLNGKAYTVIGVMPPSFRYPYSAQNDTVFLPLVFTGKELVDRSSRKIADVIARLKPGVSFAQAQAEMKTIEGRLRKAYPATDQDVGAWAEPLGKLPWIWEFVKPLFDPLYAAAIFVLVVGCVNLANLLLARGAARQHEIAVRAALGAGRLRVIRQFLTEGVVLSVLGGAAGVLIAIESIAILKALIPPNRLQNIEVAHLNGRALLFGLVIALLTGIAFSILPALKASKTDPRGAIQQGGRTASPAAGAHRARGTLLLAESALALLLLFGAGLVLEGFTQLMRTDPGFNPHRLLAFAVDVNQSRYAQSEAWPPFFDRVADSLRSLPGVSSVAVAQGVPGTDRQTVVQFALAGTLLPHVLGTGHQGGGAVYERVGPNYFKTLQNPLEEGRYFTSADNAASPRVAIVTDALARQDFGNENVLGKLITVRSFYGSRWKKTVEIVGIVRAVRQYSLSQPFLPIIYVPQRQDPDSSMMVVLRTKLDPRLSIAPVRARVAQVTAQPVYDIRTIHERYETIASFQHTDAVVFGGFALVALLLAGVGIYGVAAYGVSQRFHEIGIRVALGATKRQVMSLIVIRAISWTLLGVALGAALLPVFDHLLSIMLGTGASQLATAMPLQGGVAAIGSAAIAVFFILAVALLACVIPARRAAKVDPMVALRHE
jgi:putative ABC transport system permease protein